MPLVKDETSLILWKQTSGKPLIQAAKLYDGTKSKHVPRVDEHAIKNTHAL